MFQEVIIKYHFKRICLNTKRICLYTKVCQGTFTSQKIRVMIKKRIIQQLPC